MSTAVPSAPEQLLLELFVIFVTTKVLGEIFERLSLPAVPGEILAGVILGPFALAWIPASDTLRSVAQIGVVFIMFSAGLETSPHELIRVSRKALLISVLGVVAPFVLGFAYMKLRGDNSVEAVFVAAARWWQRALGLRHECWATWVYFAPALPESSWVRLFLTTFLACWCWRLWRVRHLGQASNGFILEC